MLPYQLPRGLWRSLSRARPVSRLKVHSTSAAVNAQPSCHFTPRRSLKVSSVLSSFQLHDSARSGTIDLSLFCGTDGLNTTRLLNTGMKGTTVAGLNSSWIDVLGGLSRWNMRSTPPRFCAHAASPKHCNERTMPASSMAMRPARVLNRRIAPHKAIAGEARGLSPLPILSSAHTRSLSPQQISGDEGITVIEETKD